MPLVATGIEVGIEIGEADVYWQLQDPAGKPLIRLEHYGKRYGHILMLPAFPKGFEYCLVIQEVGV